MDCMDDPCGTDTPCGKPTCRYTPAKLVSNCPEDEVVDDDTNKYANCTGSNCLKAEALKGEGLKGASQAQLQSRRLTEAQARGGGGDTECGVSTAISYAVLAGTGVWCMTNLCSLCECVLAYNGSRAMYGIIIANSVIGMITCGFPYGEYLSGLHAITSGIQDFAVFPIYAAILLDLYGFEDEIIYACLFVPVLPTLAYVTGLCDCKSEMEKVIAVAGSIGIGYFSYTVGNQFAIAACVTYLVKCFIVPLFEDNMLKIPSRDLANYTMCGFCYLALRSIID
ncbi:unnamed protein product [Phyllotreta striolata]|uniref:Uncharacterized protein n=1 Tax=Phyllotreta striolata TaxID=444603 RepID=A0A9N9TQD4_PHYSR|nr:unnamed protein product [Phyllotreta striolata]